MTTIERQAMAHMTANDIGRIVHGTKIKSPTACAHTATARIVTMVR